MTDVFTDSRRSDLAAAAAELGPWFQNIRLPGGVETAPDHPLGDYPGKKWAQISSCIPERLDGWTALDIGCNAGFHCVELARRGARVTGVEPDARYLRQGRWVVDTLELGDRVELRQQTVYDLARSDERFDLILFIGVFYHLRYPLLALDIVAARLARLMMFQSLSMPGEEVFTDTRDRGVYRELNIGDREVLHERGWPKLSFIEHSFAGDATNWWIPNHAGIEAMLRSAGLRISARPGHELYVCEPASEDEWPARREVNAERLAMERVLKDRR